MTIIRQLSFSTIGSHPGLRCDAKYRLFWGSSGDDLFPGSHGALRPIKQVLRPLALRHVAKGDLGDEYLLVDLEDVEPRTGVILSKRPVSELRSERLAFGQADLLTTRLRPYLGKTILNQSMEPLIGTTEWIPLRVDRNRLEPLVLQYILLSPGYVDNAHRLVSGKEHPRLAESDLRELRIPYVPMDVQMRLAHAIRMIESLLDKLRQRMKEPSRIIDDGLSRYFGFPLQQYSERAREETVSLDLADITASSTLRNSVRYHHPHLSLVGQFLVSRPHRTFGSLVSTPVRLGASLDTKQITEDGDALYVHPNAL
jgi:hypothetical protein